MAIRVALHHRTCYRYASPVWLSPHVVRLRPTPHCRTPVTSYSLRVLPADHFINWQQDPYSNYHARLVFPKPTRELSVEVDLVAELTVINPFDFFLEAYAEKYPFSHDDVLVHELQPYLVVPPPGPRLAALVADCRRSDLRTVDYLVELNRRVHEEVKYLIRLEPGIQAPEQTLELRSGSCRDSAWLLLNLLRLLGLATRFVSGYLIQLTPDVKPLEGPAGAAQDFTDLHAWVEVYLPGAGWIGLDPTSGLFAGEGHLPLACTADPVTAAPITGSYSEDDASIVEADGGAGEGTESIDCSFDFEMKVTRIHEDPRMTKPYTEEVWAEIDRVGRKVDEDLRQSDVRLTMGGEPTFVSIDDFDGPEWNTTALGPHKYGRADALIRRLRARYAPGGFLHHGQGKWYPGESLPRWALGLYWRVDGSPVWQDPTLIADETRPTHPGTHEAEVFLQALARRLGVDPAHAIPGFEDVLYYLWRERRLPVNVDPFENNLREPEERERLARVFERGLDTPVGFVLPLRHEQVPSGACWRSGAWHVRPERLYLIPGDSPMGYRLPLDSLPWALEGELPGFHPLDPMAPRQPLPPRFSRAGGPEPAPRQQARLAPLPLRDGEQRLSGLPGGEPRDGRASPAQGVSAPWVVRTAICAEPRGGTLQIFLPPVERLEGYLELVEAIEATAAELRQPVLLEGYHPPQDPRLHAVKVTPDPGVIEVNTRPVETWEDLVESTTTLYEEARLARLATEKFLLDGRHTGTGGGNHIIVGGPTPADSPLLRRPDLIASLIRYWHNHPALSYLFSSLFVGPTSQAPRVDEARNDQVYELELALAQLPGHGGCPPWLVDRVLRNVLIDATGNTHRAELCIDKLFSPDSASGRLGLLELRAFEMPPHARMSLAQHLLLRAMIAHFWRQPYRQELVRWRTEIHDRFMLPRFVQMDLEDVIEDLSGAGYPLRTSWFEPHFEFRFPLYGTVEHRGLQLELRQAIEPWHVLGEEPGAGGTVRYVDSSVERLQVLVRGMVDPRHIVAVGGVRVPLHPTGTNGEFVAGVRYRAWQPPSCLHPTIGVHSPLVFDIFDTWSGRSIGGCTYHVAHPGGRAYDRFPVNAYEAESRRVGRLYKMGHTPGPWRPAEPRTSRELPLTLDLRRESIK